MPRRNGSGPCWGGGPRTGRCRDRGSGRGFGMGMGQEIVRSKIFRDQTPDKVQPRSVYDPEQPISKTQELDMLKQQAQMLQHQMASILNRIDQLNKEKTKISKNKSHIKAFIIEERCTGCGICIDMCKQEAIGVDNKAKVDLEKCSGCGICVDTCPNEALTLKGLNVQ